ncbi:hypothetical protein A2625_07140 [candidate division WOR-1 bacterium RIFCSPHIGHO2_01_FULL_53_15]|uniref:Uncharacterized protein n=1 Tax=candidate division WOR-1 bacterium RIFCSPHIGHO2_01_FULL_53_15 TaxID=1802564 RepID=A0A1F4Q4B3_UNCSA|nr:MAG: hypothetical protein A2625_07140 [candidate division WOR-1 bacterium RIFCSPHIGHO2_01_FULL_53_15]OGC13259.1 MAG: hypothetical protein A3D23_01390 [candidate division WOR-1 bacterium RIFCSPHIGHO2_02_FULL_53_26]
MKYFFVGGFILAFFLHALIPAYGSPNKLELKVPFLCQAPFGDWRQPWQDACEEAAIHDWTGSKKTITQGRKAMLVFLYKPFNAP